MHLPEGLVPVRALEPAADAGGRTGDYISLKNADMAFVVFFCDQGNAATIAVSIEQATVVAGTDTKVITNVVPIWANQDLAAGSKLVRQTDAVNFTTSAAVKNKMVIFQIDPASLDLANNFDCITVKTGASNVANITSALYLVRPRYAGDQQVDWIID